MASYTRSVKRIMLSVLARYGVEREVLIEMVKKAMRAWP